MKLLIIALATSLATSLALFSQSYHRHCKLRVRYEGNCLCIQNRNASECPSLGNAFARDGHVLGYCDVITSLDRDRNRVPEVLVERKCKPKCTESCAETGSYFCEQIFNYTIVKENGTERVVPVPSDCLCVKNTTKVEEIEKLYGMVGP